MSESKEAVAFDLMKLILSKDSATADRSKIFETYAMCLEAVAGKPPINVNPGALE